MSARDEIAAIYAQCAEIAAIREELAAGAHPFDYDRERQAWETDAAAIAEYESWYTQKTIMEADAESVGIVNGRR